MKRVLLTCALAALTGACSANHNAIHRTVKLEDSGTQLIDAKQRAIVVWPNATPPSAAPGASQPIDISVCAEPSPDAFTVLAASGELGVSNPAGVSVAGSLASTETGASLSRRTTTILAQRDAYYRLCEARANGWIDDIDLMVGQRNNQLSLVGMLAIEQLTGAVSAPAVSIGGSASAVSASAIQAIASARTAEVLRNEDLKKRHAAAIVDRDAAKTEAEKPKPEAEAQAAYDTRKVALDKALVAAETKVAKLAAELESSDKVLAFFNKALDTAAATGSSATSMPAVIVPPPDPEAQAAVAASVVEIVRMMNSNDMGTTICLRYLRDRVGVSKDGQTNCEDILAEYANGLRARIGAYAADTLLKQELVRALIAIKNPGDPKVYKEQVKPILDLLLAIKENEPATTGATIKFDPPTVAHEHGVEYE